MGTDKVVFKVELCGRTTGSDVTGSDVTESDVRHMTGSGPVRKRHCPEVCSAHARLFPALFSL